MNILNEIEMDYAPSKKIRSLLPKDIPLVYMSEGQSAFLCGLLKRKQPKKVVEVGIFAGGTSSIIMECLEEMGNPYEFHAVDLSEQHAFDGKNNMPMGFVAKDIAKKLNYKEPIFHLGKVLSKQIDRIIDGGG